MKKLEFKVFLEDYILPVFTGSEIVGEEISGAKDATVVSGASGTILAKFKKTDEYRFIIKRIQPFNNFELGLFKSILKELHKVSSMGLAPEYTMKFYDTAVQKAICEAISTRIAPTLGGLIEELSAWSKRTYEGNNVLFGFLIKSSGKKDNNDNLHFSRFLDADFTAPLSNGRSTFIQLDRYGYLDNYVYLPQRKVENILAPIAFSHIANHCKNNTIGISLLYNGDILIFADQKLMFARRGGTWTYYSHEEIMSKLSGRSSSVGEMKTSIYLSCLDLSFAKTGGCLVYLNKDLENKALKHININDILIDEYFEQKKELLFLTSRPSIENIAPDDEIIFSSYDEFSKTKQALKIASLKKLIDGKKFYELDRQLRVELLSIDGATVVDHQGKIIAIGAIIKIDAGSIGGGRLAAAQTLANYGISTKISTDGYIQCFAKKGERVLPLFYLK